MMRALLVLALYAGAQAGNIKIAPMKSSLLQKTEISQEKTSTLAQTQALLKGVFGPSLAGVARNLAAREYFHHVFHLPTTHMKMNATETFLSSAVAEFPSDCPNVTTLSDVAAGDIDGCEGLTYQEDVATATACEEQCKTDMNCTVWQMVKDGDKLKCWSGSVVHGCQSRGNGKALKKFEGDLEAGQRIQHGFVNVIKDMKGIESLGLRHYPETVGNATTQEERCKKFCYGTVTCTVWQFKPGEGANDGCWLEHGPGHYKDGEKNDSEYATGMTAGETIEHTCPPYTPPEEGLPWPWIIAGIILGLLALAAIIYALQKKPKVKKTRAVKIEPKPEPQRIVYFVPQPTVLIPQQTTLVPMAQPTMVQQTSMVSVAQPTMATSPLIMR